MAAPTTPITRPTEILEFGHHRPHWRGRAAAAGIGCAVLVAAVFGVLVQLDVFGATPAAPAGPASSTTARPSLTTTTTPPTSSPADPTTTSAPTGFVCIPGVASTFCPVFTTGRGGIRFPPTPTAPTT
jgi:hypothetical protein